MVVVVKVIMALIACEREGGRHDIKGLMNHSYGSLLMTTSSTTITTTNTTTTTTTSTDRH